MPGEAGNAVIQGRFSARGVEEEVEQRREIGGIQQRAEVAQHRLAKLLTSSATVGPAISCSWLGRVVGQPIQQRRLKSLTAFQTGHGLSFAGVGSARWWSLRISISAVSAASVDQHALADQRPVVIEFAPIGAARQRQRRIARRWPTRGNGWG